MPKPVPIIIILLVALIAFWIIWINSPQQPTVTSDDVAEPGSAVHDPDSFAPISVGESAIFVADQLPNKTVRISFLALGASGFAAIHELNVEGFPDAVLGTSALLEDGTREAVDVALSRSMRDGERLVAMLHIDDGDGVFDVTKDAAARDPEGNIVSMEFGVRADADPDVEVQF